MGLSTRAIWMVVSIVALVAGQMVLDTNTTVGYGMMSLALVIALVDGLLFPVPLLGVGGVRPLSRWLSIGLMALVAFAFLPDVRAWFFLGLAAIYLVTGLIGQQRLAAALQASEALPPVRAAQEAADATAATAYSAATPTEVPGYLTGGLIGLGAAIVGALAWWGLTTATGYQLGLAAWILGRLVGMAVFYGAGNRTDRNLQIIGAALGGLGILAGQYLIIRADVMADLDLTDAQLLHIIITNPQVIGFMGLVFILIGIWDAWRGAGGIMLGGRRPPRA